MNATPLKAIERRALESLLLESTKGGTARTADPTFAAGGGGGGKVQGRDEYRVAGPSRATYLRFPVIAAGYPRFPAFPRLLYFRIEAAVVGKSQEPDERSFHRLPGILATWLIRQRTLLFLLSSAVSRQLCFPRRGRKPRKTTTTTGKHDAALKIPQRVESRNGWTNVCDIEIKYRCPKYPVKNTRLSIAKRPFARDRHRTTAMLPLTPRRVASKR